MARMKHCRHCKGKHRSRKAYNACKKSNGPKEYWS